MDSTVGPVPIDHQPIPQGRVGVLLVNLGTPERAEASSVRPYLREFLSDKRVVDYPRAFWLPILHGIILTVRPSKTAALYRAVWRKDTDESPLRYFTRRQADLLGEQFGDRVMVEWAMRYGTPSISEKMDHLQSNGCDRMLVVPLYPQYSGTTTAAVIDKVSEVMGKLAHQPTLRFAPPFHDAPGYIDALENSMHGHLPFDTERVILSFHGIPQRYFRNGDPYYCHCQRTARLLRERMGWDEEFAPVGFQSKFGPENWL
ncbi:MAG: ferrochelatase, partial [Pseudomonadota bacterium]